jgi:hypothetical protein
MRKNLAAPLRASKNRLVLRRFCVSKGQTVDGYQVLLIVFVLPMCAPAPELRQSTALQQKGAGRFVVSR